MTQLASYFEPLIVASVGLASKIMDQQQQMNILDQTKTLSESALQMLYAAKEGGGNPKVMVLGSKAMLEQWSSTKLVWISVHLILQYILLIVVCIAMYIVMMKIFEFHGGLVGLLRVQAAHTHDAIAEAVQLMKEAVDDIMVTLNEAASEGGMVGGMVEAIAEAMGRVSGGWCTIQ